DRDRRGTRGGGATRRCAARSTSAGRASSAGPAGSPGRRGGRRRAPARRGRGDARRSRPGRGAPRRTGPPPPCGRRRTRLGVTRFRHGAGPAPGTPGPRDDPRARGLRAPHRARQGVAGLESPPVTVLKSLLLFAVAALFEIGGAWLVWQGVR